MSFFTTPPHSGVYSIKRKSVQDRHQPNVADQELLLERERERERERDRQTDRQTDTERERQRETESDRESLS